MKRGIHVILKGILTLLALTLLAMVLMLLYFLYTSKNTIAPFYDETGTVVQGSIAEKTFIDVNGQKNGLIIRGKSGEQPVLLFLSGGPGVPQYWMNEYMPNAIEEQFTVCWWDLSGEGMSYDSSLDPNDITLERLENDTVTVVEYLKERFGVERVFLMAHSGGSPLGLDLAAKHPELFYAYFGMGQIVPHGQYGTRYQAGYQFLKETFEASGNTAALERMNRLVSVSDDGTVTPNRSGIGGQWEGILLDAGCATTREMRSDALGIGLPVMTAKCYTFSEKINFWRGKFFYAKTEYDRINGENDPGTAFSIPVYFLSGYYDYTTPVNLVQQYYGTITAPDKDMKIFTDSAHSPLWEENSAALEFMTGKVQTCMDLAHQL
jgi:pimeloyl-ACP methyl ester carboxylesterase